MSDVKFFGIVMMVVGGVLAGYGVLDFILSAPAIGPQDAAIAAIARVIGGATIYIVGAGAAEIAREGIVFTEFDEPDILSRSPF